MECTERLQAIVKGFQTHRKAFTAIGDETRQLILLTLMESDLSGIRVGEIAAKTHLTRPSVSHHLQILKDAGIVAMRREGTRNYYYLGADDTVWKEIAELTTLICESISRISPQHDASYEEEQV